MAGIAVLAIFGGLAFFFMRRSRKARVEARPYELQHEHASPSRPTPPMKDWKQSYPDTNAPSGGYYKHDLGVRTQELPGNDVSELQGDDGVPHEMSP